MTDDPIGQSVNMTTSQHVAASVTQGIVDQTALFKLGFIN
jgi:hypothetical protein